MRCRMQLKAGQEACLIETEQLKEKIKRKARMVQCGLFVLLFGDKGEEEGLGVLSWQMVSGHLYLLH